VRAWQAWVEASGTLDDHDRPGRPAASDGTNDHPRARHSPDAMAAPAASQLEAASGASGRGAERDWADTLFGIVMSGVGVVWVISKLPI
jgi:hypothetical protein